MSTSFQNKLLQYAPEPPERVWDVIASTLNESTASGFAEKLYVFEETPSLGAWDKINRQLDSPQPARVVPFFRRYKKLATYSAAAAILIVLAVSSVLVISRKPGQATIANTPANTQNQKTDSNISSGQYTTANSSLLAASNPDKIIDQKNTKEKKGLLNRLRPQTRLGSVMIAKNFIPRMAEPIQTVSPDVPIEKYMVYSDGDGNAMRLPKKLFDFISCVREDVTCRQEMEQLQQRFASTVLTTDFTGVLEILKTLKENQ